MLFYGTYMSVSTLGLSSFAFAADPRGLGRGRLCVLFRYVYMWTYLCEYMHICIYMLLYACFFGTYVSVSTLGVSSFAFAADPRLRKRTALRSIQVCLCVCMYVCM
jgi:hypothetical protein